MDLSKKDANSLIEFIHESLSCDNLNAFRQLVQKLRQLTENNLEIDLPCNEGEHAWNLSLELSSMLQRRADERKKSSYPACPLPNAEASLAGQRTARDSRNHATAEIGTRRQEFAKILVIDNDSMVTNCYSTLLHDSYSIRIAADGLSALTIIKSREEIDIVLLDYKLPDMLGLDVLKEIKKNRPHIPVIVVTAFGDEDIAAKSFRYGAREYIKKPFKFRELFEKIQFCLSLKNVHKDKRETLFHEYDIELLNYSGIDQHTVYKIQKAINFIENNFMSKICLSIVADQAGMSKYHFSKIFKRLIGITYQDYLNKRRIEKAKKMIESNCSSITEIAFSVGYDDLTHFGRLFKRIVGHTPSQYKCIARLLPPENKQVPLT
jgi:YesN/AraC family two-component response regulator